MTCPSGQIRPEAVSSQHSVHIERNEFTMHQVRRTLSSSALLGLSLIPYVASVPQLPQAIVSVGIAKTWPAWILWAAIAVAVLYRILGGRKRR
mgnify:CR=1 FL=1